MPTSSSKKSKFAAMKTSKTPRECDVVIIGGGITGILSAYFLSKQGKEVILIEKEEIGKGATQYTTAFLTQVIDTSLTDLIKIWGPVRAREIVMSHQYAIECVEDIINENKIDCSFVRCSNHLYANSHKEYEGLKDELFSSKKLGLNTKLHMKEEMNAEPLGFSHEGYLEFPNQAKIDPFSWINSLADLAHKQGAKIHQKTEARSIKSDGRSVAVETAQGTIIAKWAIVATYKPFNEPQKLKFKTAMYKSYVYMFEERNMQALKEGIYEDTLDPYHYFRVDKEKDKQTILIGGEDHRDDIPLNEERNFRDLKEYMDKIFDKTLKYENLQKWTGPILESVDGLSFIGHLEDENILYATAFSGNGMTYSMIAARIFEDTILGKHNHWLDLYNAMRTPNLKSLAVKGRDYLKGNVIKIIS
jgi:glycine/D-amino acid oxidase-like deaminating enzyme